jgi:hypothetical protein
MTLLTLGSTSTEVVLRQLIKPRRGDHTSTIGNSVDSSIMNQHKMTIPSQADIPFESIRSLRHRALVRRERVLRLGQT